jgi:hypothetical protein
MPTARVAVNPVERAIKIKLWQFLRVATRGGECSGASFCVTAVKPPRGFAFLRLDMQASFSHKPRHENDRYTTEKLDDVFSFSKRVRNSCTLTLRFGFSPTLRAVSPTPDGSYSSANTAEGDVEPSF